MWRLTKELDPTRLVEDNSPTDYFRDHVITDLNSWHFYLDDPSLVVRHLERVVRETYPGSTAYFVGGGVQDGAPLICSEYSPVSALDVSRDVSWGFKYQTNALRAYPKIAGFVYTQLTDVEWEHNGIVRYDRSPKEFGYQDAGIGLEDLTGPDFLVLHTPPALHCRAGTELSVEVAVSYFSSETPPEEVQLNWQFSGTDVLGRPVDAVEGGPLPVSLEPFRLSPRVGIRQRMPETPMVGNLLIWAEDGDSGWNVRNYLPVHVGDSPSPRQEVLPDGRWLVRWGPGSLHASNWTGGRVQFAFAKGGSRVEAITGFGEGLLEYRIAVPAGLAIDEIEGVALLMEISAALGSFNAQTDTFKTPTQVRVLLNGVLAGEPSVPDAPADARGVMSYLYAGLPPLYGSYGYLASLELAPEDLPLLREALRLRDALL
jgi:hypothetical protein